MVCHFILQRLNLKEKKLATFINCMATDESTRIIERVQYRMSLHFSGRDLLPNYFYLLYSISSDN